jgi:hypothetical protein
MMDKKYRYFMLHLAFYFGGLISGSALILLAMSALAGLFPRVKQGFIYYFLLAVAALGLAMWLHPPQAELMQRLSEVMGLGPVPFWLVVALVSALTMVFTALAVNRVALPRKRNFGRS